MTEQELSERRREWLLSQLPRSGMSAEDLAGCTRYALGQIRLWLRGAKPISAPALRELALALSVDAPAELQESS